MVLTLHDFTAGMKSPEESWFFSPKHRDSNWLFETSGFRILVARYGDQLDRSVWRPAMLDIDDHQGTFSDNSPGTRGIPAPFVELCELDETSDGHNNPYHGALRTLSALLRLEEPLSANFTKLLSFVGRIDGPYRELLKMQDPRALLILSYYLALLCRLDMWWIENRARNECIAICGYLERQGDTRILNLLEFPSLVCGYQLSPQPMIDESVLELDPQRQVVPD
jgi:hypothetical protein